MKSTFVVAAGLAVYAFGASTPGSAAQDRPILEVSVTTVQVDVIVTDRDGKQMTDLRPEVRAPWST
jgi:hypothetical protein